MTFADWTKNVPLMITGDSLWRMEAYRLALFAADLAWPDVTTMIPNKRGYKLREDEVLYSPFPSAILKDLPMS